MFKKIPFIQRLANRVSNWVYKFRFYTMRNNAKHLTKSITRDLPPVGKVKGTPCLHPARRVVMQDKQFQRICKCCDKVLFATEALSLSEYQAI